MNTDPWAPWAKADPVALEQVFTLTDFEAQVRALLDLAPKASAKEISALPWEERHEPREFRAVRDAWALERQTKRSVERDRDEQPLDESVRQQFEDAVRTHNLKAADEALALLVRMGTAKGVKKAAQADDDFSKLTELEVLMLGALVHKLRGEPLTSTDDQMLAYVALIDLGESAPTHEG